MALARLNNPSELVYGETILPCECRGQDVDIDSFFEAVGQYSAGIICRVHIIEIEFQRFSVAG